MNKGIKNGWGIQTIPDAFFSPAREFTWRNRRKQQLDNPDQAVSELRRFLVLQGQEMTDADVKIIREHAIQQYCSTDPSRCPPRKKNKAEKAEEANGPKLPWSRQFWQAANMAVSAPEYKPETLKGIVSMATALINGPEGCIHCAAHWKQILEISNPDEVVKSADDARCWLWAVINATREGKKETPYLVIAKMWKWPPLTAEALKEAVTRMHLTDLP